MRRAQGRLIVRYGVPDVVPPGFKPEQFIRCLGHHGANGYGMYVKEEESSGANCSETEVQDAGGSK